LLALLLATALTTAHAADADKADEKPAAAQKPAAPTPIPLGELSAQADAVTLNLREITTRAGANPTLAVIERDLPALTREIDLRLRENARIISQKPSLELLRTLSRNWRRSDAMLTQWSAELEQRVDGLDRDLSRLDELEATWKETLAVAQREQAPSELVKRAESVLGVVAKARSAAESQRALALRLQSRVAAQAFRVNEAIETIAQTQDATLARVFQKDSAPLWQRDIAAARDRIAADSEDSREAQWLALGLYLERHGDRLLAHGLAFALLAGFLYWVRRRIDAWAQTEQGLQRPALVFRWPVATALLVACSVARWFYPEAPRLLWACIGALALAPAVIVVRRLLAPYLVPLLYALVALYLVDQIRAVTASIELVPRIVFFVETACGAGFLAWYLLRMRRDPSRAPAAPRARKLTLLAIAAACAFFVATALANVFGYVALANLVGNGALRSMYFGLVLYALVEIIDALVIMALRVKPLELLGMVRRHAELLRRRTRFVLNAVAIVLWTLFTLDRLAIRQRVVAAMKDILEADLSVGSISLSLGDVLAFVIAVWASFLVSRLVRFVLEEEVYPHARLKRGLPYAISQTVHYLILVLGFFVAMAALGIDMTKFTILAGAFTVGVGFGLQNIFNNFVSGLILLFERPVQVGDVIQIGDTPGAVERIGMRASILRTPSGSEIIVPNSKLISDQLVNWTFSDRQRGLEVGVSVVLGSDPKRVIEVLEGVATDHPKLVNHPPPKAILTRMGPDWMGFELHAATDRIENWLEVRSEVAVAVHAALGQAGITLR
jgi:small-conductance mechanosensitive channel